MALCQALLDVVYERRHVLRGRIGEERFQSDVWLGVVGETQLVQDAQLVVVFEDGRCLAWRAAQRLLLLYVVGEFAERLQEDMSTKSEARDHVFTYRFTFPPLYWVLLWLVSRCHAGWICGVALPYTSLRYGFVKFAVLI